MTQAEVDAIVKNIMPSTAAVKIEVNKPGLREHVERTGSPPRMNKLEILKNKENSGSTENIEPLTLKKL